MNKTVPIDKLSFEEAMKELKEIVSCLERGSVTLEDSICFYERGEELRLHCDKILKNAEHRVEKIIKNSADDSLSSVDIT